MAKLPVFSPLLLGNESRFIERALADGFISGTSPVIGEFERGLAHFFETPHAVAVANGTVALHAAVMALGLSPGDEVLMPDFTIISNALAVVLCGATPVFVDVNPTDWCLDTKRLRAAITPRTKGIMAVHMYGNACQMDDIMEVAKANNLWVIEDAAQAQGAKWRGKTLGTFGNATTLSFYANKLITTGEGGAVLCQDAKLRDQLLLLRNLGFDPRPEHRFVHAALSNNYRMSSLQAAMGLAQLEGIEELLKRRSRVRDLYQEALCPLKGFSVTSSHELCEPAFWMCTLCLDEDTKISVPELQARLWEEGIETRRFFYPLHRQPVLSGYHRQSEADFPVSDAGFERGLYLPSSSTLTHEAIQFVASRLEKIVS